MRRNDSLAAHFKLPGPDTLDNLQRHCRVGKIVGRHRLLGYNTGPTGLWHAVILNQILLKWENPLSSARNR